MRELLFFSQKISNCGGQKHSKFLITMTRFLAHSYTTPLFACCAMYFSDRKNLVRSNSCGFVATSDSSAFIAQLVVLLSAYPQQCLNEMKYTRNCSIIIADMLQIGCVAVAAKSSISMFVQLQSSRVPEKSFAKYSKFQCFCSLNGNLRIKIFRGYSNIHPSCKAQEHGVDAALQFEIWFCLHPDLPMTLWFTLISTNSDIK